MGKNITKADIVNTVAKSTGVTKIDTKAILEGFISTIIDTIADGHKIEIRGFGVFHSKKRKAKLARNPKTGEIVSVPEKIAPIFKSSAEFSKKINKVHYSENQSQKDNE